MRLASRRMADRAQVAHGSEPRRHRLPCASAAGGVEWVSTSAILGSCPVAVASPGDDVFKLLDAQSPLDGGDVRVGGGWIGWLGYPLGYGGEGRWAGPP